MIFEDKIFIGNKIRHFRKTKGLTQSELAEKVGLCEKHIGQIERGAYLPSLNNFFSIVKVLDINLVEFGISEASKDTNPLRETLMKIIYSAEDKELQLYYNIITGAEKALK